MIVEHTHSVRHGALLSHLIIQFEGTGNPNDEHTIISVQLGDITIGRQQEPDKKELHQNIDI